MPEIKWKHALSLLPVLALASVGPNAFPVAQLGYASLHDLALYAILPALLALSGIAVWSRWKSDSTAAQVILSGAMAGSLATLALEAFRYPGFRLGFMPGNLPELMGVLLLDQFAQGPSTASSIAGYAYHAWNGASFGIIFAALLQIGVVRRSMAWTVAYGVLIGAGFLASPVVQSLGGGPFGIEFGLQFAGTVLTAHAAFGFALSLLLRASESCVIRVSPHSAPASQSAGAVAAGSR